MFYFGLQVNISKKIEQELTKPTESFCKAMSIEKKEETCQL